MSHFYGMLQGNRGDATRCGSKQSGLTTYAAGWQGAIRVSLSTNDAGEDIAHICLDPWQSSGGKSQHIATVKLDANEKLEKTP